MKIAGWICFGLGILSLFGAASAGNSIAGPCFWIALGLFLLYKSKNKKDEPSNIDTKKSDKINVKMDNMSEYQEDDDADYPITSIQKESAVCLIVFFAGFNPYNPRTIIEDSLLYFEIPIHAKDISLILSKYQDADKIIDTVLSIKSKAAKEYIIKTCYKLAKMADTSEAMDVLLNMAKDMGYNKRDVWQLVKD